MPIANRTDSAQWRARLPHIAEWRKFGLFTGRNLAAAIEEGLTRYAATPVVFAIEQRVQETSAGELWSAASRVAGGLLARGMRSGDAIVTQLPNCREMMLIFLAALKLGLVLVPVVHIYGAAELGYILRTSRARALVMPGRWRKVDFAARIRALESTPDLEMIFSVGDTALPGPCHAWSELETWRGPQAETSSTVGDDICIMNFTSGTTSAPKGVMLSHHALQAAAYCYPPPGVDIDDGPVLNYGPAGHIGPLARLPRPFLLGDRIIHVDQFEAEFILDLYERYRVARTGGVPTHLNALLDACGERLPASITNMLVGATSVPPALVARIERLGVRTMRSWGCTEQVGITAGSPHDPLEKRVNTDGRPVAHNQVRAVDDSGRAVPAGEPGELISLGPQMFQGYLDASLDEAAFTGDGFYRTGDIGVIDRDGYVTIVDRKKDIVVRGGENISSREVEELLLRHPAVREAAVVGWPDQRLGERVGAFVQLNPGTSLTVAEIRTLFEGLGVARQKTPEHLVIVPEFPRTPIGKVIKAELRKQIALSAPSSSAPASP